ncbi:MAG: DUF1614 domain-containing protein [Methanocellales archaeon]|nr:DUF1614 domain-containing protein [Methanocellales archaeon]
MLIHPVLMMIGLTVLAIALILYLLIEAFKSVGFTVYETLVLLPGSIVAFRFIPNIPIFPQGNIVLCFNVAGCLIPLIISWQVLKTGRAPLGACIIGVVIVSIMANHLSSFVPGKGVIINNIYIPSLAACLISIALSRKWERIGPVSYVSSSMGILIGCDLLRLREILSYPSLITTYVTIGGAGIFDAIFVAGIVAIMMDIFVTTVMKVSE